MKRVTREQLDAMANNPPAEQGDYIKVGMSSCGMAAGAEEVYDAFVRDVEKRALHIPVKKCGCAGMCYAEPLVEVKVGDLPPVTYCKVDRETALRIVEKHVVDKRMVHDHIIDLPVRR